MAVATQERYWSTNITTHINDGWYPGGTCEDKSHWPSVSCTRIKWLLCPIAIHFANGKLANGGECTPLHCYSDLWGQQIDRIEMEIYPATQFGIERFDSLEERKRSSQLMSDSTGEIHSESWCRRIVFTSDSHGLSFPVDVVVDVKPIDTNELDLADTKRVKTGVLGQRKTDLGEMNHDRSRKLVNDE